MIAIVRFAAVFIAEKIGLTNYQISVYNVRDGEIFKEIGNVCNARTRISEKNRTLHNAQAQVRSNLNCSDVVVSLGAVIMFSQLSIFHSKNKIGDCDCGILQPITEFMKNIYVRRLCEVQ